MGYTTFKRVVFSARVFCALVLAGMALTVACRTHGTNVIRSPSPRLHAEVADSLRAELARRVPSEPPTGPVPMITERSATLPELAFHWGVYSPPGSADVSSQALVVVFRDRIRIVRHPQDASEVIRPVRIGPDAGLDLCAELATKTMRRRGPRQHSYVFRSDTTLARVGVRDAAAVLRHATGPEISVTSTGWTSRFWMVEPEDLVRYSCTLREGDISLSPIRRVEGIGIPQR
jgi:hypothetical protein